MSSHRQACPRPSKRPRATLRIRSTSSPALAPHVPSGWWRSTHSVKEWAVMLWSFPGVRPFSPSAASALSGASPSIGHPGRNQHSHPQRAKRRRLCWKAGCPCGQSPLGTSCSLAAPRCRLAHPKSRVGRPHHRWSSRLGLSLLALAARDGCREPARALRPRTRTPRLRKRVPKAILQAVRNGRQ
jgi:hypothetical protein